MRRKTNKSDVLFNTLITPAVIETRSRIINSKIVKPNTPSWLAFLVDIINCLFRNERGKNAGRGEIWQN